MCREISHKPDRDFLFVCIAGTRSNNENGKTRERLSKGRNQVTRVERAGNSSGVGMDPDSRYRRIEVKAAEMKRW